MEPNSRVTQGLVSRRRTLILFLSIGLLVLTLFFNNCQPWQPVSTNGLSSNGISNTSGSGGSGGSLTAGEVYFQSSLIPVLQTNCSSCHSAGKAPVRIFDYAFLRGYSLGGTSVTNSPLYNKVRDAIPHGVAGAIALGDPADLCPLDNRGSVSPCREIRTWLLSEYPQLNDSVMQGQINYVNLLGEVSGYAINSANPAAAINVVVYANAPFDQGGVMIGTFSANMAALNTVENGHTFRFTLPPAYRDGIQRRIYIYGVSAVTENLLFNSPFAYVAFPGSGQAYFENTVRPRLSCSGCHFWTYEEAFAKLAIPLFTAGGTATNNTLINKMSGVSHGGGNVCPGGKASEPCASVQNWWNQEF